MSLKILFSNQVNTWTEIGTIATLFAVVVALFGQKFISWIWRPRLAISSGNQYPYIRYDPKIKDPNNEEGYSAGYYIQLNVTNVGCSTAHGVYGKLIKFTYEREDELW